MDFFEFFRGMKMNFRGLMMGLKTPTLFFLGMTRFVIVVALAALLSGLALYWHKEILDLVWQRPEAGLIQIVWGVVSWLISLMIVVMSILVSYLISQIFFGIFIMDQMSRITERIYSGNLNTPSDSTLFTTMVYLVSQEIPRAIVPVALSLVLMLIGFLTPMGPVMAVVSSLLAAMFLAWDNTDLLPARRMIPFGERWAQLKSTVFFHLGFGIWFLIPGINIVFLAFAPVGGTLFHLEGRKEHPGK